MCGSNQHLVKDCPEKVSKKEKKKRKREKEASEQTNDAGYYDNSVAEDSLGGNFAVEQIEGGLAYKESFADVQQSILFPKKSKNILWAL